MSGDPGDKRRRRLLYMEDEPVTARVVQKRLQEAGFAVDLARRTATTWCWWTRRCRVATAWR
jgi:DNA-binding response OmpR family regulator